MFSRDNIIGWLLLGLCAAIAIVMIDGIVTGTTYEFTGPSWVGWLLGIIFIGGLLFGMTRTTGRWPHPMTGRRSPWHWPWQRGDKNRDDNNDHLIH